ncbi:MAG: (Fe-S)-binding protein [Chloroflexota bacterium]
MSNGNKDLLPPGLAYLADNISTKDNILGTSKESGVQWAKDLNLPPSAETIFFAGCGYQFNHDFESLMSLIRKVDKSAVSTEMTMNLASFQKRLGIDVAGIYRRVVGRGGDTEAQPLKDAVKVLDKLGIKVGYLGQSEPCCGGLLHYAGLEQQFTEHARKVSETLKSQGVKRLIGLVPSCTYTLKKLVPEAAGANDIEVKHFAEVVAEKISSLNLRYPREVKVTYHDPCQLVRYLGIIEEPRQILKAIKGIELVETNWTNKEYATCCGGGGGFEAVFPELSQILAVNRVKELLETKAEIIVTHCPGCLLQLKAGLGEVKADKVEVLDLAQIVATAMEAS